MIRKLIIGNGRTERELLLVGNIIIGRDPSCHVSEPDPLLSRRHAEIIANVHGVSIRDLNSRNGILVNGAKTREQVLLPGDVVQLGHLQLRYVEDSVRAQDAVPPRGIDPRRQPAASPYDIDRFRPEPTPVLGRWRPEPTPLPGRIKVPQPPPPARPQVLQPPLPRGRAAFDETIAIPPGRGLEAFDQTMAAPRQVSHHDTTLGHAPADLDQTMLAPRSMREPSGINRWPDANATIMAPGGAHPDQTMMPGDNTFAAALSHLAGLAGPGASADGPHAVAGAGEQLVANAELTVLDATPGCAALLGIPDEQLIGDSLADVFLRAVRRAYTETDSAVTLSIARGARGSITVTFTLDRTSGTE